ncbi:MAG: hypothetical protein QW279_14070 [Candidatus Jordarchaeaceae archaeon]
MKINIFYSSFIIALIFTLFVGVDARGQVTCPDGYRLKTVEFELEFNYTDTLPCKHPYSGICKYKAYFCVRCGTTAPTLDITLMKIELLPLPDMSFPKGYVCTCKGSLTWPPLDWRRQLIIEEAYSKLFQKLVDEDSCYLNVCDGEPPSQVIEASLKTIDCYKLRYVPICIGEPPILQSAYVAIEYCPESSGYCEYLYRVCVQIDPITGKASLRKELIRTSHFGTSNCVERDLVLPPGTPFPRFGDCFPDETECMYDPECR